VCTRRALRILWNESSRNLCEKMVETAYGVLKGKQGKAAFFNFVIDVTPDCDCLAWSDNPIVQDVGVLGSTDPVAVEQASLDMVNARPSLPDSEIDRDLGPGTDKFMAIRPDIDGSVQMEYAEKLGMGTRVYELVNLDEKSAG
ncbi:MAG: 4Fe-4S ferredoxin, partial [Candidatus Eisenbacteria bacterium]|nr:4Fe-4S ferredoxin [Candidatus Eisenbacteria bacterium]